MYIDSEGSSSSMCVERETWRSRNTQEDPRWIDTRGRGGIAVVIRAQPTVRALAHPSLKESIDV